MTQLPSVAVVLLVILTTGCGSDGVQETEGASLPLETAEEWTVLFDGETMNGWEARPTSTESSGDWTVADGTLVCGGTVPSWIHTDAEFSDYRLTLEFQGPDSVNSGVFLRSQKEGQPHRTGYELQIWDHQPAGYNTGSLVNYISAPPAPGIVPDEWNRYDITARGDRFIAVLNGDTILDATDATHSSGVIGLQCQEDYPIRFRDIRVMPLN